MVIRLTKGLKLSTRITLDTELFSYSIYAVIYVNYTVSACNFHGEFQIFLDKRMGLIQRNLLITVNLIFDMKFTTFSFHTHLIYLN